MYTFILMSSRGNLVRQYTITRGRAVLLGFLILAVCLGTIGGLGSSLFQNHQLANAKKTLEATLTENERLTQAVAELTLVNEEMKDIRRMAKTIQQGLGILSQNDGDSPVPWMPEGAQGPADTHQQDISGIGGTPGHTHDKTETLTPSLLKQAIMPLYNHVNEHQKQIDGYPSILPVKLEKENGEKHVFWYSSRFGWRIHPLTKKREFHQGLDIKTQPGVPVIAAADGEVTKAQRNGYLGKAVEVNHIALQLKTLYAHLNGYADGIKVGKKVKRGDVIGYVGNTGRSTGPHLHYGIYDFKEKQWVNPNKYIFDQQPAFPR